MAESTPAADHEQRGVMDLAEWRRARARGELWMYVDANYELDSPAELTGEEWAAHIAAMCTARSGRPAIEWIPRS